MTVLRQSVELTRNVDEVPMARTRLEATMQEFGCVDEESVGALLLSELVTNAIRHGRGSITVCTECFDHRKLRVTVHDEGRGEPRVLHPSPAETSGGRGLMLVDAMAGAWGIERDDGGTGVWFELPVAPARDRTSA